jgi:hypothetical protein
VELPPLLPREKPGSKTDLRLPRPELSATNGGPPPDVLPPPENGVIELGALGLNASEAGDKKAKPDCGAANVNASRNKDSSR